MAKGSKKTVEVKAKVTTEGAKESTQQLDLFATTIDKATESSTKLNETTETTAKSSDKVSKALEEETKKIQENTEAVEENTKAKVKRFKTITELYKKSDSNEQETFLGTRVVESKRYKEGGVQVTKSKQVTTPKLPSTEEIKKITSDMKAALSEYKTTISNIISSAKIGFDVPSIKSRISELQTKGIKTSGLLSDVNRIEGSFTSLENTNISNLEKSLNNLVKKFEEGKISAKEFDAQVKSLGEDTISKVNEKIPTLVGRVDVLHQKFKEAKVQTREYSSEFKESANKFLADATKNLEESKTALKNFNEAFNFDEIKEKLESLKNSGVHVDGLLKSTDLIDKQYHSLNETLKTTEKELKDLNESFKNGKIGEKEFAEDSEKLGKKLTDTKLKLRNLGNQFDTLKSNMEGAAKKAKETGGIFDGLANRFKIFWQYRVINTMTNALYNLSKAAVELEASFANIQAITGATDTEMDKLRNTILKVGEASKYSTEEISNATVTLGQAGLTADEINNVLETTTQLAAATGSSLQNTVDLMTSALAVWGLNSEEAGHLSDVMVTGMNRTKATLETFRMAVQYAGATMASLNVNFDEFASVAAAASNAGLRASVVGTGLRAVTSELISPTTKMVKGLTKLGLSTEDVNIESQGLVNVLYKLKNAGLDASNAYSLFGRRAAQFILAAQGQLDVVDELREAFTESGATLKAYGTQMDTVKSQWVALSNTIKSAAYDTYDSVSWLIKDLIKLLNLLITALKEFVGLYHKTYQLIFDRDELKQSAFSEVIKEFKDGQNAAVAFYKTLDNLSKRDYGDNAKKAVEELNKVIKAMNKELGLSLKYIDSIEELPEAYDRLKNIARGAEEGKIRAMNATRMQRAREYIADNTAIHAYNLPGTREEKRQIRANAEYLTSRVFSGEETEFQLERRIKSAIDKLEKEGETETAERIRKSLNLAKEALEKVGDAFTRSIESQEFRKQIDELKDLRNESDLIISNYREDLKESLSDYNYNVGDIIKTANIEIKEYNKQLESINETLVPDDTERNELISETKKQKDEVVDGFISLLKSIVDNIKEKLKTDIGSDKKTLLINQLKEGMRGITNLETLDVTAVDKDTAVAKTEADIKKIVDTDKRNDARNAREIEREKAREFNKKYQNLKLQAQADEYQQKSAEATRKGVISKLGTRDTTGTLASYYSSTAEDLSKLESLKTAISNKETLETYKKDYGDLFEQVKSGKVTLEDADNKTASLINEMMTLDSNVKAAEAEFGNLNDVDLSDLNSQITTLQDKLNEIEESSETEFGKLKEGFKSTVESMSKSYGSAKLGSMIAEDLGNGMSDALYSVADGTNSMKEAFSDMARSILQDISKMLIKMAVLKTMEGGLGLFGSGGAVSGGDQLYQSVPEDSNLIQGGMYANGGFIPKLRATLGTPVRGGISGKDSVPAMLMPGEYVLKKSAVDALGTNFLNDLNNNAAQTLAGTASNLMQNANESSQDSEPTVVNVWVVSKEEEAKMGPNDVIATISKDIMTGGTTRRLIQSVVAGRK